MKIASDYLTVFHYEGDLFQRADISERIARDGDENSEFAGLDGADPVRPTQQLCCVSRDRANYVERRHSRLPQIGKSGNARLAARLFGIEPAHIRTGRELHT